MWLAFAVGIQFAIPAGQAPEGFRLYGEQSRRYVLFEWKAFEDAGVRTNAVYGEMSEGEAIAILTAGTDIEASIVDTTPVTVLFEYRPRAVKQANDLDTLIIGDVCQFGMIPSHIAATKLGDVPGHCWCCAYSDERYSNYLSQKRRYDAGDLLEDPAPVDPPSEYFCAAFSSSLACSAYDTRTSAIQWEKVAECGPPLVVESKHINISAEERPQ